MENNIDTNNDTTTAEPNTGDGYNTTPWLTIMLTACVLYKPKVPPSQHAASVHFRCTFS